MGNLLCYLTACNNKLKWFKELYFLHLHYSTWHLPVRRCRLSPTAIGRTSRGLPGLDLLRAVKLPPARNMETSDEVCSLRCSTMHYVPNKARPAIARAFSAALMAVIFENSVTAWLKLFLIPKCVLPSAKRSGCHNKLVPIESLCAMWVDGLFCDLWRMAQARVSHSKQQRLPKEDTVKKRVSTAISLALSSGWSLW